ncbi:ectoine hydroxylase [Brevibacillus brevis]|uniref:ectoine hydroxylase n=1 Tax=Brevibacillus brevis TaxID=1393 RepID=UPI000D100944|nr:ectoine hydroxylase [Brevibacillus brevis]PSJ68200.1 ectoine hydroxylase [Brevibacillus brevis]RED35698.1 ectoine hydroxylase [Brevibacillus brevis]GEC89241.1 ectoine hydroxylase [Brevibacillus brevis]VEF89191.1 ectoine hydroxylase [Brevibacillus brevis]
MKQSRPELLIEDQYPSRIHEHPALLQRVDPVVYWNEKTKEGPLTQESLQSYEKKGYISLRGFFSPEEVQELRDELTKLWQENRGSTRKEVICEPHSNEVRSIFAVHRDNLVFQHLSRHPRLVSIAQQILGSEVYIHQSRINYKHGFTGKEFYWHSDFETWHVEDGMPRMRALSCSISLEENYHYNGPLLLLPGSHQTFVSCVGQTPESHYEQSLRKQEYGVPDQQSLKKMVEQHGIDTMIGPSGSVVFFDCNTMHGSNGNITPMPRSNVFMVYNSVENRLVAPFSGQKPRPDYIATRD